MKNNTMHTHTRHERCSKGLRYNVESHIKQQPRRTPWIGRVKNTSKLPPPCWAWCKPYAKTRTNSKCMPEPLASNEGWQNSLVKTWGGLKHMLSLGTPGLKLQDSPKARTGDAVNLWLLSHDFKSDYTTVTVITMPYVSNIVMGINFAQLCSSAKRRRYLVMCPKSCGRAIPPETQHQSGKLQILDKSFKACKDVTWTWNTKSQTSLVLSSNILNAIQSSLGFIWTIPKPVAHLMTDTNVPNIFPKNNMMVNCAPSVGRSTHTLTHTLF